MDTNIATPQNDELVPIEFYEEMRNRAIRWAEMNLGRLQRTGCSRATAEQHVLTQVAMHWGAEIELDAGDLGDHVGACAAFDGSGVDCDAAAHIVPGFEASDLSRDFVDGVDAVLWSQTGVRSAAVDDEFGFADAFALGFERSVGPERWLEDEDGVAAASFGLD